MWPVGVITGKGVIVLSGGKPWIGATRRLRQKERRGRGAIHKVDDCMWGCDNALQKFESIGVSHHVGKRLFFWL